MRLQSNKQTSYAYTKRRKIVILLTQVNDPILNFLLKFHQLVAETFKYTTQNRLRTFRNDVTFTCFACANDQNKIKITTSNLFTCSTCVCVCVCV